jgi:predicted Zn-dependent protease
MLAENGVNVRNEAAHLLGLAAGLRRARKPAEAIVPLQAAALLRPDDAAIFHDLGLACLESGRVGEAIVALQRAVAICSRSLRSGEPAISHMRACRKSLQRSWGARGTERGRDHALGSSGGNV